MSPWRSVLSVAIGCFVALAGGAALSADQPSADGTLRVLSYNIHHGEGTDGRLDLERIARVIRQAEPDLVALQEVDRKTRRSGEVDQPAELARLTGLHVAFGGNLDYDGGRYGNAVLSRFPIRRQQNHPLPSLGPGEPRGVLEVEVEIAAGRPLVLLATHFDHRRDDRERIASAQAVNALLAGAKQPLAILAGDLNDVPQSPALAILRRDWLLPQESPLPTSPATDPRRQIDYVLVRPAARWKAIEVRVLEEPTASDHRPLVATFALVEE